MTKSTLMSFLTGIVFFVMTWTTANAHVSFIEPQAARSAGVCEPGQSPEFCNPDTPAGSPEEDFSFDDPFVMAPAFGVDFEERFEGDDGTPFGPNIELSKAIHAYLSPEDLSALDPKDWIEGDVDWYKFVLDEDELSISRTGISAAGSALVSANALPWRCDAYKTSLPTIALIGPGLPRVHGQSLHALPSEVQDALTSSEAGKEKWGIFVDEDDQDPFPRRSSHFGNGINVDWWGGNPAVTFTDDAGGFRGGPQDGPALTEPGTYYLVVWDPNGDALDYTLSSGFHEQDTEKEDTLGDGTRLLFDNDMLLNFQCNDPCDGVQDSGFSSIPSIGRQLSEEEEDINITPGPLNDDNCGNFIPPFPVENGICGCIGDV